MKKGFKNVLKMLTTLFSKKKEPKEQKEPIFSSSKKNYVGINNDLIEEEILTRVDFKMSEFNTSLNNIAKRIKNSAFYSPNQTREESIDKQYLSKAIKLVQERFDKERYMGSPMDGLFKGNVVESKNGLVEELANVLLKRGTPDYNYKKSRINNLVEKHIYKNNI